MVMHRLDLSCSSKVWSQGSWKNINYGNCGDRSLGYKNTTTLAIKGLKPLQGNTLRHMESRWSLATRCFADWDGVLGRVLHPVDGSTLGHLLLACVFAGWGGWVSKELTVGQVFRLERNKKNGKYKRGLAMVLFVCCKARLAHRIFPPTRYPSSHSHPG